MVERKKEKNLYFDILILPSEFFFTLCNVTRA